MSSWVYLLSARVRTEASHDLPRGLREEGDEEAICPSGENVRHASAAGFSVLGAGHVTSVDDNVSAHAASAVGAGDAAVADATVGHHRTADHVNAAGCVRAPDDRAAADSS